jgi:glycerophosphoryl diester phosphodiesterase
MHSPPAHGQASLLKLLANKRPLVIGHRGYCQFAPENTVPSFEMALRAGADLVEMDYRHSADGVPVVIHDRTFDRTTDARRKWHHRGIAVASKTAAEIQTLDAGSWFDEGFAGARVPLLSEALRTIQNHGVALIERKSGDALTCAKLLRHHGWINHLVIQSFDWQYLRQFHEQEPHQLLAALGPAHLLANGKRPLGVVRRLNRAWLVQAQKSGARVVVWSPKVSKGSIRLAHTLGLKVWVYTVNNARLAKRLLRAGVDGLITDNPSLVWKVMALDASRMDHNR